MVKSEGRLEMERWMGGDALICSSRFDICPTPLSSLTQHNTLLLFFLCCPFLFSAHFSFNKSFFFYLYFGHFLFFLHHSLSRASNTHPNTLSVTVRRQGSEKRRETKEGRKKRDSTWLTKLDKVCFFQVSADSLSPELTEVDREESRK